MLGAKKISIQPKLALLLGVAAVSSASILIRLSLAPPLITAAYRLGIATSFMGLFAFSSANQLLELDRRELAVLLASGFSLAIHFWSWISSLELIPVATSVILVDSASIFASLSSKLILREALSREE